MPKPAKPGLGRKVLKTAGMILGGLVVLVLLVSLILLAFLEPVVGRILKDQVRENTDGLYTLDFEDMQLSLLTGTVSLQELVIFPDTAVHQQQRRNNTASRLLFRLETPHFQVSRINVLDALFRNKVTIGTVVAERPVITLITDERIEKDSAENKEEDDSIPEFLDNLNIGKIEIQDASFRYLALRKQIPPIHEVTQVSLSLHDFNIAPPNKETNSSRIQADDVQLTARNYTYRAPDSVYQLQVTLFTYSSEQSTLLAEGIVLLADQQNNTALPAVDARHALYNIEVPALRATGLALIEAYRTKHLSLEELSLERPAVHVVLNNQFATDTASPDIEELYQELSAYLTTIELGALRLKDGNLKVSEQAEKLFTVHELEGTNIALQEVLLDSSTLLSPKNHLFAEALLFSAESYAYQHPLSPHVIRTGNMELSTEGNFFLVNSIHVIGDREKNDRLKQSGRAQPLVYNINSTGLHFRHMNLLQALQTDSLIIGTIDILSPSVEIARFKSVKKPGTAVMLQNAYAAVSDYISSLLVRNINIQDASFRHLVGTGQLRHIQELNHINLKAIGLVLDSAYIYSPSAEGLPVEDAVLTAHDYTFRTPDKLYTFTLDRIQYSTQTQILAARAVALSSSQAVHSRLKARNAANRNLFDVSASHFNVTGLNIIKAIDTGELLMDQVMLRQPDFNMLSDRTVPAAAQEQQSTLEGLYNIVNPIRVNSLRMEDGTFTYHEKREDVIRTQQLDHASATVLGLNLGAAKLNALDEALPMQEMTLTAAGYSYRSPDGIYTITLDSLLYSSRQQELTARHINVVSDKEVNARLKRNNREQANRNLFDVSAERFLIRGLDLLEAYETGRFEMAEMLLHTPEVAILQDRNVPSRSEDSPHREANKNDSETLNQLAEVVEAFRVGQLRVDDGNVRFNILQDTVLTSQRIAHVSVAIDQLRTVSLETMDPLEMFRADDIGVLVRNYMYQLPDSLYTIQVGEVRSSLQDQTLQIEDLRLLPLFGRDEFMSKMNYEEDRFDVHVPEVLLRGVDLNALFNNQDFIIRKALVNNPVVEVYRDKRLPENPDRRPPTLQEMLRQTEYLINVDTLAMEGGVLTYVEVAPNGVEPGVLLFEDTNLEVLNITNDAALLSQNSVATVNASALLMGESEMSVRFLFHLTHPEDLYTYEGTLKPMDFTALNPLFKNLIFVSIEDGQIDKASFSVEATEHMATGKMRFYYNDFEVLLLDKEDPENPGFLRKAGSWVLNKLVIKSNNPAGRRDIRLGTIEVERDYSKSVFNHMGKAMIDGITSSLMIPFVERIADKLIEF